MGRLPAGRVTFVFIDVVGSTRLFSGDPDNFAEVIARVQRTIAREVRSRGGSVVKTLGDGAFAAFARASAAVEAMVAVQAASDGGQLIPLRAGGHSGEGLVVDDDYVSFAVHVASRVCGAAGAGQALVSQSVVDELAAPVGDLLGMYYLRDIVEPVALWLLCGAGNPPGARPVHRTNVPASRTSFLGREADLTTLGTWLKRPGLSSVVGPGGVGKTRLVSELVLQEASQWDGGAWLVELATVARGASIIDAVGSVLQLKGSPSLETICHEVGRRGNMILVLDNCEHVLAQTVDVVDTMQSLCPQLRLVTTSRERLELEGERVLRLSPLPTEVDGESASAQELLIERASAAGADVRNWKPTAVQALCQYLAGLPLAIELAAARAADMPLPDLLNSLEVDHSQLSRRGGSERQRSVHNLVAWSTELLSPEDRVALLALAVMPGGFTARTARRLLSAVPGANTEAAAVLARCSLIDVDGARFRMLAVVRGVVRQMLGDEPALEDAARRAVFIVCLDLARETDVPMGFLKDIVDEDMVVAVAESLAWAVPRREPGAHQLLRLCRGFADFRMRPPSFDLICDQVLSWNDHDDLESAMLAALALRAAVATRRLDQLRGSWGASRASRLVSVVRADGSSRELRLCLSAVGIYCTKIEAYEVSHATIVEELQLVDGTPELAIWRLPVEHDLAILAHDRRRIDEAERRYRTVIVAASADGQTQLAGMAVANLAELLLEESRPFEVLELVRPWLSTEDTEPAAALRWGIYVQALVASGAKDEARRLAAEAERRLRRTAMFAGATRPCLDALLELDLTG